MKVEDPRSGIKDEFGRRAVFGQRQSQSAMIITTSAIMSSNRSSPADCRCTRESHAQAKSVRMARDFAPRDYVARGVSPLMGLRKSVAAA